LKAVAESATFESPDEGEEPMKSRLPLVLSVMALVVALLGPGRFEAVAQTVANFARNADRVDGIHASRTPRANRLFPLGPTARFPRSVIPRRTAFFSSRSTEAAVPNQFGALDSLQLPRGAYVIVAKAWFRNDGSTATPLQCRLTAGGAFDESDLRLEAGNESNARSLTASFTLARRLAVAGPASLRCRDFGADVKAFEVRITALAVDALVAR
jgi:hypothetical protein